MGRYLVMKRDQNPSFKKVAVVDFNEEEKDNQSKGEYNEF